MDARWLWRCMHAILYEGISSKERMIHIIHFVSLISSKLWWYIYTLHTGCCQHFDSSREGVAGRACFAAARGPEQPDCTLFNRSCLHECRDHLGRERREPLGSVWGEDTQGWRWHSLQEETCWAEGERPAHLQLLLVVWRQDLFHPAHYWIHAMQTVPACRENVVPYADAPVWVYLMWCVALQAAPSVASSRSGRSMPALPKVCVCKQTCCHDFDIRILLTLEHCD